MGAEVRLRHAELLNEDGTLNLGPNENAEATDVYILRGGGPEVYEPRFTYHGFRYVEMTGYPGEPGPDALEGLFVHSDVERTGEFRSSNELIDRIHRNVLWGQLSNLMSIPTDCPQRDERHGWLGDAHLSAEEAVFNFDMAAFYAKFLDDIRLAQKEDGSLPDVVPPYLPRLYPADPAWSSAYATLVGLLWDHYGDRRVVATHYASLKKYIDFLGRSADRDIIRTLGKYGDWCPPGGIVPKKTPVELTSTWYYYHDVLIVARLAGVLGRGEDAQQYTRLAAIDQVRLQRRLPRRDPIRRDPRQPRGHLPQPDLQRPAPLLGHGPREQERQGRGQPPPERRPPAGLPRRHRHPGHALHPRRPDRSRRGGGRLPHGDPQELSRAGATCSPRTRRPSGNDGRS